MALGKELTVPWRRRRVKGRWQGPLAAFLYVVGVCVLVGAFVAGLAMTGCAVGPLLRVQQAQRTTGVAVSVDRFLTVHHAPWIGMPVEVWTWRGWVTGHVVRIQGEVLEVDCKGQLIPGDSGAPVVALVRGRRP